MENQGSMLTNCGEGHKIWGQAGLGPDPQLTSY